MDDRSLKTALPVLLRNEANDRVPKPFCTCPLFPISAILIQKKRKKKRKEYRIKSFSIYFIFFKITQITRMCCYRCYFQRMNNGDKEQVIYATYREMGTDM